MTITVPVGASLTMDQPPLDYWKVGPLTTNATVVNQVGMDAFIAVKPGTAVISGIAGTSTGTSPTDRDWSATVTVVPA